MDWKEAHGCPPLSNPSSTIPPARPSNEEETGTELHFSALGKGWVHPENLEHWSGSAEAQIKHMWPDRRVGFLKGTLYRRPGPQGTKLQRPVMFRSEDGRVLLEIVSTRDVKVRRS